MSHRSVSSSAASTSTCRRKFAVFRHTPWLFDRASRCPAPARLGVSLRRQHEVRRPRRADRLHASGRARPSAQGGRQAGPLAEARDQARGRQPDQRAPFGHGSRAEARSWACRCWGHCRATTSSWRPCRSRGAAEALTLIRDHCREIDGFIATSGYYADFMSGYLAIPRERIHVVYPGLNLRGHGGSTPDRNGTPFTIGYFARICPEKGLHVLAEAFRLLRQQPGAPPAGCASPAGSARTSGLIWRRCASTPGRRRPRRPLRSRRVARSRQQGTLPARTRRAVGADDLPRAEGAVRAGGAGQRRAGGAAAARLVPRVDRGDRRRPAGQSRRPGRPGRGLRRLADNRSHGAELGRKGQEAVRQSFHAAAMADETVNVYRKYVP